MKKLENIYIFTRLLLGGLIWLSLSSYSLAYESSIQNSNFLAEDPVREKILFSEMGDKRTALLWRLKFEGEGYDSAQNSNAQIVNLGLDTKFRMKLIENLDFKAKARMQFQSGRAQDPFGDVEPNNGIYLREAILQWRVFKDSLALNAGVISQRWLNNQLFITGRGFPGVRETLRFSNKNFDLRFIAQQLIPTSSTLSTRVAEKEETPTFFTESLEFRYITSNWNWISGRFTLFEYNDLPSVVAFDSQKWGNIYQGGSQNNANFLYEFKGWMSDFTLEQKLTDNFSAQLTMSVIKNTSADSQSGESQTLRLSTSYDIGFWMIQPKYEVYFIEPEAVPSYYNSWLYGHNNRSGQLISLGLESKEWGLRFKADYVNAKLLQKNGTAADNIQPDDTQIFLLSVETSYDSI